MVELVGLVCGFLGLLIGSGAGWYIGQRALPFWERPVSAEERPAKMPRHDHDWHISGKVDGRVQVECIKSFGGWRCEAKSWADQVMPRG